MTVFFKRKHPSHIVTIHLALFFVLFPAGVLLACLRLREESFWLGYQAEAACRLLDARGRTWGKSLAWIAKNRLPLWAVLCVSEYFCRDNFFLPAFTGWAGLSLGFLFASLAGQFAFRSIFLDAAILLPQTLVYLPLYRLLIRNNIHREAAFFLKFLLLSALFLAGALSEYFLNPWLLQKTYHLMALLS